MALSYKDGKVMDTILEFVKVTDQTDYSVNGIDPTKAVFFWRAEQQIFETIAPADYTLIDGGSGNYTLRIDNATLLTNAYEFQVCYENAKLSSEYITALPDIDVLKDKYNEAVGDITVLWKIIEESGLKADTSKLSLVVPELAGGETFAWNDTDKKFYAVQVVDLDAEASEKIAEITAHTTTKKGEIDTHVETVSKPAIATYWQGGVDTYVTDTTKPDLDTYRGTKETELDSYVTLTSKPDLDTYTTARKGDLDTHTTTKEGELDTHTTTKKGEIDTHVDTVSKPAIATYWQTEVDSYITLTSKPDLDAYTATKETALNTVITSAEAKRVELQGVVDGVPAQITSINSAGTTNVGNVTAEGTAQVTAVTNTAEGYIRAVEDDRELVVTTTDAMIDMVTGDATFHKNSLNSKVAEGLQMIQDEINEGIRVLKILRQL